MDVQAQNCGESERIPFAAVEAVTTFAISFNKAFSHEFEELGQTR